LVISDKDVAERVCYQMVNTAPEIVSFQSCCVPYLENDTALACYISDTSSTNCNNFFIDNKVVLLSTVFKYYFSPSHFVFETQYTA